VVDVDLSGYSLDDEIGSSPYRLPSVTLKPGERIVFYGSETGLLLSDGGDGVRLLKPNGQLADAYNYFVVRFPDQSYCRLPDNGGLDDWKVLFPNARLRDSLSKLPSAYSERRWSRYVPFPIRSRTISCSQNACRLGTTSGTRLIGTGTAGSIKRICLEVQANGPCLLTRKAVFPAGDVDIRESGRVLPGIDFLPGHGKYNEPEVLCMDHCWHN
jgi:hypothetical protein